MAINPNYIFPPTLEDGFLNHVELLQFFSPPECDSLIQLGTALAKTQATVGADSLNDTTLRKSVLSWLEHNQQTAWMWDKLAQIVQDVNKRYYNFQLLGFNECAQFTEYDGEGAHYTWHMDYGAGGFSKRKLSLVVQLADPSDYDGENLELFYGSAPFAVKKGRGNIAFFPSYTMHRVTPVTRGRRYTLVLWVSGQTSYR